MAKLRVHNIAVSLDGYAAGPAQDLDHPMGVGGENLHNYFRETSYGQEKFFGQEGGSTGLDDTLVRRGDEGIGATIMGRNMFGPIRGDWGDESWTGWWGEEPPYHHDVYVLTHHPRADLTMAGGTTFHFVTDGIHAAHEQAFAAAGGQDVRLGGGVSAIRAYLAAGLVDEMHIAVVPLLLGSGERLLDGEVTAGYRIVEYEASPAAAHYLFARAGSDQSIA